MGLEASDVKAGEEQDGRERDAEGVKEDERGGVEGTADSDAGDDEDGEWQAVTVTREEVNEDVMGEVVEAAAAPCPPAERADHGARPRTAQRTNTGVTGNAIKDGLLKKMYEVEEKVQQQQQRVLELLSYPASSLEEDAQGPSLLCSLFVSLFCLPLLSPFSFFVSLGLGDLQGLQVP